jgi:hypothetical protein
MVKTGLTFNLIAAGVLLSGCASGRSGMILGAVGPVPDCPATVNPTNGALVVYSAYEVNADFNSRDPYHPEYSDYEIYIGGKLLRRVHNDSGTLLQDPALVELPAGQYRVVARANGYGEVTIPVFIRVRQSTVLHLEGGGSRPNPAVFNPTNAVYLPDGQVVGWRAGESSGASRPD